LNGGSRSTFGASSSIYRHEALGVNLQPLKFMEFSLEKTAQTVAISGEKSLVVNIPSPVRYALHKLVVMGEREEQFRTKIAKDAAQVAAIVSYVLDRSPRALQEAVSDILDRGRGWRSRAAAGLKLLALDHAAVAEQLAPLLKSGST
jgi:hypothetical protein